MLQDLHKSPRLRKLGICVRARDGRSASGHRHWLEDRILGQSLCLDSDALWDRIVLCIEQMTWINQVDIDGLGSFAFIRLPFYIYILVGSLLCKIATLTSPSR